MDFDDKSQSIIFALHTKQKDYVQIFSFHSNSIVSIVLHAMFFRNL